MNGSCHPVALIHFLFVFLGSPRNTCTLMLSLSLLLGIFNLSTFQSLKLGQWSPNFSVYMFLLEILLRCGRVQSV